MTALPVAWMATPYGRKRARAFDLPFQGRPGVNNAITDVPGVGVGFSTLIEGHGPLGVGHGPVRTGVTAILPRPAGDLLVPVFAGYHNFNGNGELTGAHFIDDMGYLGGPISLTNTHSCGVSRDASVAWMVRQFPHALAETFCLPVAAETYDGFLNDINGFHVREAHVLAAIDAATTGPCEEGSVGGGTGMKSYGFKAGSGTASRTVQIGTESFTMGAFVQANFGRREHLSVLGQPIGRRLEEPRVIQGTQGAQEGSLIVVLATDAPLLPLQLRRCAKRATLGMARTGCTGGHGSGDLFLAFSTANAEALGRHAPLSRMDFVADHAIDSLFEAAVQATEEAILNSLVANEDMTGRDDHFVPALPHRALSSLKFDLG